MNVNKIRTVDVTQYITPLREGGSLPAIVEANDGFKYVIKFRGAGQGKKALIAELIGGELARAIGLNVPELVFMNLDESYSKTEGDEEIQDLLKFSVGLNLGLHYLSGSITYDPLVSKATPSEASKVVLLDSIIMNIDRTPKNTNLLNWNNELWLIDHGASLYFHHSWNKWQSHKSTGFPLIKEHVLLEKAFNLEAESKNIIEMLTEDCVSEIVAQIPKDWMIDDSGQMSIDDHIQAYNELLNARIRNIESLCKEAINAR